MRKLLLLGIFISLIPFALAQEDYSNFAPPSLSIPIIIGLGIIDSINPCVIGVLILLLTMLLKSGNKKAILINGITYTIGVYVTYLVGGLTLLELFNSVRDVVFISQLFYFVIGSFVMLAGFLEVKDFFWYGKWFSLAIPKQLVKTVEKQAKGAHISLIATFSAGAILTLVELPCTGAPYLAVLTLMSQSGYGFVTALPLLLLYNLVFVLPLLALTYLAYTGMGVKKMEAWRKENRGLMRLGIGLALLLIGIWILATVADYLLLPLVVGTLFILLLMFVLQKTGMVR